jgi:hypothetical protein
MFRCTSESSEPQPRRGTRSPGPRELPVHDEHQARHFVAALSGHDEHVVGTILDAQTIYLAALGVLPGECVPAGVDLAAEVAERYDLFPEELRTTLVSCWELEAEFASQRTGLPYRNVLEVLLGASAYELAVGIIDGDTYSAHQRWVAQELQPVRGVDRTDDVN